MPANTGNILRLAMAISARVIIIGLIPFTLDDKSLKRAGMDYLLEADYVYYSSYDEFLKHFGKEKIFYVTRFGKHTYSDIDYTNLSSDINLMFGKESTGIDKNILRANLDSTIRIPILSSARSLNLANSVAIVAYEVLRQNDYFSLAKQEQIRHHIID